MADKLMKIISPDSPVKDKFRELMSENLEYYLSELRVCQNCGGTILLGYSHFPLSKKTLAAHKKFGKIVRTDQGECISLGSYSLEPKMKALTNFFMVGKDGS